MTGFFGYVGSVGAVSTLNVRAVTRVLLRRGAKVRSTEDRDVEGRFATILVECGDAPRGRATLDEEASSLLAPVLMFDGPRREAMVERLSKVRDVDSFVTRELDVGSIGGGFAFAIWGRRHRTLALGCDGNGIHPVYFFGRENWFVFSSEVGALLASDLVRRHVSPAALHSYLRDGGLTDECLIDGVRRLRPGTYVIVRPFTSSTGRLRCSESSGSEVGALTEIRDTVAAQISPGDPAVLLSREAGEPCSRFLDAVRQAGAGSIVRLAFTQSDSGAIPGIVDHSIDMSGLDPVDVLDGVLSSWDQPVADGIVEWLAAREARRLGSKLLLCDLAVNGSREAKSMQLVDRALKRSSATDPPPLFEDREIDKLACGKVRRGGERGPAPRYRIELASLTQMAVAHSVGCCVPMIGGVRSSAASAPVPTPGMIRSWILDHYFEQALDGLQALAEAGILSGDVLRSFWNRFRFDPEPATTSRMWALVTLGAWVRRHEVSGLAS